MTNQNGQTPPPVAPLPPGYWFAHLDHFAQEGAMKEGRERVAEEFAEQVAVGVMTYAQWEEDPEKRKMGYRRKPVALWVGQRVYFPWSPSRAARHTFEHNWADWERIDPEPEGVELRAAIIGEVEAQAAALTRQLLLQDAQARAGPPAPAAPGGPQGEMPNVQQPVQPQPQPPAA